MIPQSKARKPKNSSKVNLLISLAFHAILVLLVLYFAARTGLLGKQIQKITVTMERKEKPPEKPPEPPKQPEPPKIVEPPKLVEPPKIAAAPPADAPPAVAPPAVNLPSFDFSGGKAVIDSSDPVQIYKGRMEYILHSKWNRPEDMADDDYVAEVSVGVDKQGRMSRFAWLKGSGNSKWDNSVKDVFKDVKGFDRPPPTNFPPSVVIRFDVVTEAADTIFQ